MKNMKAFGIWEGEASMPPGSKKEYNPTLVPYFSKVKDGPLKNIAMLVFPGGGYWGLAEHEGKGYAEWFNQHGADAFVLNYSLGSAGCRHPAMIEDAKRAMRIVRKYLAGEGKENHKIGVIGSSAGGHLASTLLTKFDVQTSDIGYADDRISCRPDFGVLCYPVISMLAPWAHMGSRENLLGKDSPNQLAWELSSELHVTPSTPPCFLWHTMDDAGVPVENSIVFAQALRSAGVPVEMHLYESGPHGLGLGNGHPWTYELLKWLERR